MLTAHNQHGVRQEPEHNERQQRRLADRLSARFPGLVCQEAENIRLRNVTLISTDTTPVLEVQNSRNIVLDGIRYAAGAELLLRVTGDRSRDIRLINTDTQKAKRGVELGPKMAKKTVTLATR